MGCWGSLVTKTWFSYRLESSRSITEATIVVVDNVFLAIYSTWLSLVKIHLQSMIFVLVEGAYREKFGAAMMECTVLKSNWLLFFIKRSCHIPWLWYLKIRLRSILPLARGLFFKTGLTKKLNERLLGEGINENFVKDCKQITWTIYFSCTLLNGVYPMKIS